MHARERHVGVERLTSANIALHEVDGATRDLGIDQTTLIEVVHLEFAALFAFTAFHDVRKRDSRGLRRRFRWPECLVGRSRNAIPFVKALVIRQAAIFAAEVPFSKMSGAVPNAGKQLGNRHFPLRESLEATADG